MITEIHTSLIRPQLQISTLVEGAPVLAGKGSLTAQQLEGHLFPRQLHLLQEADFSPFIIKEVMFETFSTGARKKRRPPASSKMHAGDRDAITTACDCDCHNWSC